MKLFFQNLVLFIFLNTSFCSLSSQNQPFKIIFPSTLVSLEDLSNFLESHPSFISYSKFIKSKVYQNNSSDELFDLFSQAKVAYQAQFFSKAKKFFKLMVQMKFQEDWDQSDHVLLTHAHFRLAELEENKAKRKILLKKALVFSQNKNIDQTLYPKELISEFEQQKKDSRLFTLSPLKKYNSIELLINGQPVAKEKTLYDGLIRLTYWSPTLLKKTEITTWQDFLSQMKINSLEITGNCQSPQVKPLKFTSSQVFLLYPNNCIAPLHSIEPFSTTKHTIINHQKPHWFYRNRWSLLIAGGLLSSGALMWNQWFPSRQTDTALPRTQDTKSEPVIIKQR